jgi:hypothetical protein
MCPQCGAEILYIEDKDGTRYFFRIERETGEIEPTKEEFYAAKNMEINQVKCSQCSWQGGTHKLKKYFY